MLCCCLAEVTRCCNIAHKEGRIIMTLFRHFSNKCLKEAFIPGGNVALMLYCCLAEVTRCCNIAYKGGRIIMTLFRHFSNKCLKEVKYAKLCKV